MIKKESRKGERSIEVRKIELNSLVELVLIARNREIEKIIKRVIKFPKKWVKSKCTKWLK